jgi:hypothetical protein
MLDFPTPTAQTKQWIFTTSSWKRFEYDLLTVTSLILHQSVDSMFFSPPATEGSIEHTRSCAIQWQAWVRKVLLAKRPPYSAALCL